MTFMILPDDFNEIYTLYSVVKTDFGGDAINFICEGSYSYCVAKKDQLEYLYNE